MAARVLRRSEQAPATDTQLTYKMPKVIRLAMHRPIPPTWGDCVQTERYKNCEVARCRHNLRYDINRQTGRVRFRPLEECCSLAVAADGQEKSDVEVARIMGISRQRVEAIMHKATRKLESNRRLKELYDEIDA